MPCVLQCDDDELHKFDNMWFSDQTSHDADWVAPAFEQFYEEVQKGVIDPEGVDYKLPCKVDRINIKTDNCAREFNCAKYLRDVFERCEESNMDECWAEYGAPFHGKGPCDATGAAGKAGVNKGLATPGIRGMNCGVDGDNEVAKCVVEYMKKEHCKPDGWASVRNIRNIPMKEIVSRPSTEWQLKHTGIVFRYFWFAQQTAFKFLK